MSSNRAQKRPKSDPLDGMDLIREGITTWQCLGIVKFATMDGMDLIREGITTLSARFFDLPIYRTEWT